MSPPNPTEEEITWDVYQFILEMIDPGGADISLCFERAAAQPPITPESLAELDMPRIINNPKLRHDVNFDRELHFRPNLDGSKGRQKLKAAEEYWRALEGELFMYSFVQTRRAHSSEQQNAAYWERVVRASQKRLPKVFEVVRDILKTLVPDYDQPKIVERLDVDLLMQEIRNGVCDLLDLSDWLALVLKNHCAPMRDSLVDRMLNDMRTGALAPDHGLMVSGLRQLLGILEAMKLDVANHQIRHMRPLLIEDTINFQRRYNAHRISMGKIKIETSRLWLQYEMEHRQITGYDPSWLDALSSGLLRDLIFANSKSVFPPTFYLDADRLWALRIDLHSIVYKQICDDVLADVAGLNVPKHRLLQAMETLHASLAAIVGAQGRFADKVQNIAVEVVRIALVLQGRREQYDSVLMEAAEQRLTADLRSTSRSFAQYAHNLSEKLIPQLEQSVQSKSKFSALELQEALVPPTVTPQTHAFGFGAVCQPIGLPQPVDPETEIIRRLTHVLILHWNVWAELAYLVPPKEDIENGTDDQPSPNSGSCSPTVPVAQAVYSSGRKWLPTGLTNADVPTGMLTSANSPEPETDQKQDTNEPESKQSEQPSLAPPQSPS